MLRDPRAFLWDAQQAAGAITQFTAGLDAAGYPRNQAFYPRATANHRLHRAAGRIGVTEQNETPASPDLGRTET